MPAAPTEEYTWLLETCSVFIIINCRYYVHLVGLVVVDSSKHNNPCLHSHLLLLLCQNMPHRCCCIFHNMLFVPFAVKFNPLKPKLNPICYLLALLGAHHFLHVSRIKVKLLTFGLLMSYIYGAPILDVSRSHTTTQHSR